MRPVNRTPLKVQIGAMGHCTAWLAIADFAAASRACRDFIEAHGLGASEWRGAGAAPSDGVARWT